MSELRKSLVVEWADAGMSGKAITLKLREKGIKTGEKTVRKILIEQGFEYDKSNHTWHRSIVNNDRIEVNRNEGEGLSNDIQIMDSDYKMNSVQRIETSLSLNEFDVLKQLIHERMNKATTQDESQHDIYLAIAKLKDRERSNRTFYMSTDITTKLIEVCEANSLKASHVVEIALLDLFKKYDLK